MKGLKTWLFSLLYPINLMQSYRQKLLKNTLRSEFNIVFYIKKIIELNYYFATLQTTKQGLQSIAFSQFIFRKLKLIQFKAV